MATLTGFSDYIKAKGGIVMESGVANTNSLNPALGLSVFDDVKSKAERVLNLKSTMVLNEGNPSAAFLGALTATGKQSSIAVNGIAVENTQLSFIYPYSAYDFDKAVTAAEKKMGSKGDDAVYLNAITGLVVKDMIETVDECLWQGDKTKSGNLGKFDGFIKQIKAGSPIKTGAAAAVFASGTAAITKVEAMIAKYNSANPKLTKKVKRLFVSNGDFEVITRAYSKQNGAVDKTTLDTSADVREFTVPGTKVIITAADGLDGTFERVLCRPAQLCPITDSVTEDSNVNVVYNDLTEYYYIKGKLKLGAKAALIGEIVIDMA